MESIDEADNFLDPVLRRSHTTSSPSDNDNDWELRKVVIEKTLGIVEHVHTAYSSIQGDRDHVDPLTIPKNQKTVDVLIDLVVIEGVYPCLSPGVGTPMERRLKSALKGGLVTTPLAEEQDNRADKNQLLDTIVSRMYPIAVSHLGLAPNIQERAYVDLIAAAGQLAFAPECDDNKGYFTDVFKALIIR
ncbi:MAG: hypothetical protein Q9218_005718 [Villophora microphyllina]